MTSEVKKNNVMSFSQAGLEWVGREGALTSNHPYLFVTQKGQDPFVVVMQKLHELNDFCVVLFEGVRERIRAIPTFQEEWEKAVSEDEEEELFHKYMYGYEADKLGLLFCPASSLVMLYATYIQALHTIAGHYGSDELSLWRKQNASGANEYRNLIQLLRTISSDPLEIFENRRVSVLVEHRIRKLRNAFMHGKWNVVEENLVGVNVRSCFEVVSNVLAALEEVFDEDREPWKSKWTKIVL
jgi:hypothetical protein